ncbi:putative secreted oxidoreductase [Psychrobacter sp. JCM 18902]|nr:putative secreted oxidoreductase [Psychrobacter sp. JCM 18902]
MTGTSKLSDKQYDVVVVGGGIVGLASAYAAVKKGLKVALVEREAQNKDASIRNFGFVTVSGQRSGEHWQRAMHSRNIWRISRQKPVSRLSIPVCTCWFSALKR